MWSWRLSGAGPLSGLLRILPHRTDIPLNVRRLKHIGIAAIGHPFVADISVDGMRFVKWRTHRGLTIWPDAWA